VSVRYVELTDYLAIAAEITGLDANTLIRVTRVDLAESALHAPAAGFGETEFYPDFTDKAAVLLVRLAKNHPLPDGNQRAHGWHCACSSRSTTGHGERSQR
jgi:death-on-curing protein